MNTKLVNSAAGVILAALTQNRTAAGIALALDSAQLLMTPETAAELKRLRERVVELEEQLVAQERPVDEDPITFSLTAEASCGRALTTGNACPEHSRAEQDVTPQVQKLRELLAGQRAALEDPHDSPLHHGYRVPRDLPEVQR